MSDRNGFSPGRNGGPRGGRGGPPRGSGGGPPRGGGGGPPRGGGGGPPRGSDRYNKEDDENNRFSPPLTIGRRLIFEGAERSPLLPIARQSVGRSLFAEFGGSSLLNDEEVATAAAPVKTYALLGTYRGSKPEADYDDRLLHMDLPENDAAGNPVAPWCVQTARGPMQFTEPEEGLYAHDDAWLSNIPRIVRPTEPGVYTWIMYTTDGDFRIKFVCKRVYSLYEIGSRHLAIARDPALGPIDRIYGAGELRFDGTSIDFNCSSGAYMLPLLKGKLGAGGLQMHRPSIVAGFRTFFEGVATHDRPDTVSLLTQQPFAPIPDDILKIYERRGITMTPCTLNSSSAAASFSSAAASHSSGAPRKSHRRRRNKRRSTRRRRA